MQCPRRDAENRVGQPFCGEGLHMQGAQWLRQALRAGA